MVIDFLIYAFRWRGFAGEKLHQYYSAFTWRSGARCQPFPVLTESSHRTKYVDSHIPYQNEEPWMPEPKLVSVLQARRQSHKWAMID